MTSTIANPPPTGQQPRILLHGVSWSTYAELRDDPENRGLRMTYDRGELELMSPSRRHEHYKIILDRLIAAFALEFDIPISSGGSTTHRREDLERGLEPDQCYYIQNEARMRGRMDLDLAVDPPPDLAVEVEVSRGALDRMDLYAALGVPEVWRWDGEHLRIGLRDDAGRYAAAERSRTLPFLPPAEIERALRAVGTADENHLVREFLRRVRTHQTP